MQLSAQDLTQLKQVSSLVRQDIIEMINKAGSGHPGGSLGITDILVSLYFKILKCKSEDPEWNNRDRLILSHGHVCPALYSTLARAGYFSVDKLQTFRSFGSPLQGHPHRGILPGIETTSGPLGCGLSQGVGMALIGKIEKKDWKVVCLMSDGEQDEGNTWEGAMLAAKNKLDNLVGLIDRNGIQVDGRTETVMPLESLKAKYEAFGWKVIEIDGHDYNQIIQGFEEAGKVKGKPILILAKTIPGKGVSFMEGKVEWHSHTINQEEKERALEELNVKS